MVPDVELIVVKEEVEGDAEIQQQKRRQRRVQVHRATSRRFRSHRMRHSGTTYCTLFFLFLLIGSLLLLLLLPLALCLKLMANCSHDARPSTCWTTSASSWTWWKRTTLACATSTTTNSGNGSISANRWPIKSEVY